MTGRYYAMDRDKRWDRIELAYEALCNGVGEETDDVVATIRARYAADEPQSDEFLKPIIVNKGALAGVLRRAGMCEQRAKALVP